MNIGLTQQASSNLDDLPGIVSAKEQRRAFGKAKRHTWAAKFMKFFLPLVSFGIFGLYFLPDGRKIQIADGQASIEGLNLSSKGLKMINPRYSGGNEKLGRYKIEAEYALQNITATHILELHMITGNILQPGNKTLKLKANEGIYDTKKEFMELKGGIVITTNQGMEAHLQTAKINMKKQVIISDKPVRMKMNENVIDAANMHLDIARKSVLFGGGVKVRLLKSKSMTQ
ncbi:MAG: LPS export ABC transporter periplasmic protein LptC [Hyphomicrobiaceae bacterium]|nr:LPS export ABC transporter periplasmic protein LptC [Hyphomicrobiaceae bacterium]